MQCNKNVKKLLMILDKIKKQRWKMYLIYKCIYELLNDRKYTSVNEVPPSYDEFVDFFCNNNELVPTSSNLTFVATRNKMSSLVYFLEDESVGIKHMIKIYDLMMSKNIRHCILIYDQNITFSVKKYVQSKNKEIQVEFFCHDELLINKTKHYHSPKYIVVGSSELKNYGINDADKLKLPKILSNDHISKYFGLKRGDFIKIVRTSETVGEYTTFRVCC